LDGNEEGIIVQYFEVRGEDLQRAFWMVMKKGASMEKFTREQAASWCAERGISISPRDRLQYDSAETYTFTVPMRPDRGMLGQAAGVALKASAEPFAGGLVFVRSEDVQPELWENFWGLTEATIGLLRQSVKWQGNLEQYPAQCFGPDEQTEALAFVSQAVVFSIDAYFVPEKPDYIALLDHDEVISLFCKDAQWHEIMSTALQQKIRKRDLSDNEHNRAV
jgi:hypothetical protein